MSPRRHAFHIGKHAAHEYKYHDEKESHKHGLLLRVAYRRNEQTKAQNTGNVHYCKQIKRAQTPYNLNSIYIIHNKQTKTEIKNTN